MQRYLTFNEKKSYSLSILKASGFDLTTIDERFYNTIENTITFNCVGVFVNRKMNLIIFPKEYLIPQESKSVLEELGLLLKTIQKFNRKTDRYDDLNDNSLRNGIKSDNYIASMIRIVEYFFEHGLLNKEKTIYKKNSNKRINWSKTLKHSVPLYIDHLFFYLDTISNIKKNDYNTNITNLNKIALYESFSRIGFLFEAFLEDDSDEYRMLKIDFKNQKKKYLYFLKRELEQTYNTDKIELLNSINTVLFEWKNDRKVISTIPFVTCDFEDVWQDVVSESFGSVLDRFSSSFPSLIIEFKGNKEKRPQIPDTLVKVNDLHWMILDAKYYSVDSKRPGKDDFLKQYFYEFSFKQTHNRIDNVLIFNYYGEAITYLGKAQIEDTANDFINNRIIYLIGIDQRLVYKAYALNHQITTYMKNELLNIIPR